MRVDVSVIFAVLSSPSIVASNVHHNVASRKGEAMLGVSDLGFAMPQELAPIETTDLLDAFEESSHHRELQFTDTCNATYTELWKDQALNDAYAVYSNASDAALQAIATANYNEVCTPGSTGGLTCDFDEPVDGETEFTNACTAAGGEILPYSLDVSCDGSTAGSTINIVLDLPTQLECVPAAAGFDSCKGALVEAIQNATEFLVVVVETGFTAAGFSDVACTIVDVGTDTSAPGGGETSPPGDGETSPPGDGETSPPGDGATTPPGGDNTGGGGGASEAPSLARWSAFGLMAIVSLTLG